ncbi:hypothetical protein FBU30_006786 [Linnemannia zychae]|nr:hypothetical protein FBU30_006786 [Linnemannia zychae]
MYSHHQPQQLSNLSKSLPPTPSQIHPAVLHETDPVPDDYFGDSDEVPLPFPINTIVADPQTGLSLTLISALGAGSYAVVYLAKEVASGTLYALKCLGKNKLTEDELTVQRNEVVIHTSLPKHRNIIHLFNMFETTQHLFLLLEYSSGMDMYQWISMRADKSDPISEEPYSQKTRYCVIKSVFDQVLEGVSQVHQHGIAHRDLKPENFLIEFADGQYTVKITDFGLATTDSESDEFECGSKPYMSFECRNGLERVYNVQMADIWSLGIILINLIYHRCPWSDPCPQDSYAFSEFLKNRVDFLQRRFEDMPGPVARWLGLRAFAFDSIDKNRWRRKRPTMKEWREWMVDFVPRMLGQINSAVDNMDDEDEYDCEEEYRAYLAYYEDEMLGQEVEGDEILEDSDDEDMDNQVVPIAIQSSSLKDKQHSLLDPGKAYSSYHVPSDARIHHSFASSSAPKFDASAFYQPTRLRQESWSDAIDIEGTEDAEMDFSAPILFEESEEEDLNKLESEDDDSGGLAIALPDDFIDPLPDKSATSSGRQTPTPAMTHLNFNSEKRQLPAHLRLDPESPASASSHDSVRKIAGRGSPGLENNEMNTLVFIEPDISRGTADSNQNNSITSSLPTTSHLEAAMGVGAANNKERVHLKQHMRKPARNLQDVKAAPFVFPPLKTPNSTNSLNDHHLKDKDTKILTTSTQTAPKPQHFTDSTFQQTPKTLATGNDKSGPYVIPKRSQLGPWAGQAYEAGSRPSEPNSFGAGRSPNWKKSHHRGGSWTSTDIGREGRRDSTTRTTNDGSRTSSGKWRARLEDREDGHVGLPPRVENKFRPRYRQGQGHGYGRRNHPQTGSAALPPTPPIMHMGFGGPRSRHQSRSGTLFDPTTTNDFDNHGTTTRDAHPLPQDHAPRYEHSQLRIHGKPNPGTTASRLASQRNKSLVDLRSIDVTNQPWRQQTGSTEPNSAPQSPLNATANSKPQNGNGVDTIPRKNGLSTHPLEQNFPHPNSDKTRPAEKGLAAAEGDTAKDNIYHPPHWHERKSISSVSNQSRRPSSGYESDIGNRHRHDTSGSLSSLSSLSKSQSGSRGGVRSGAGAGGGYSGLHVTSPPLDRKQGQQRTADTATNWRAASTQDSMSRHSKKGSSESGLLSLDSASSSLISLNLPTRIEGSTDSPSMILTPPTPNVNRKSEFLSGSPVPPVPPIPNTVFEESTAKKIVKPGTMAGLGSMLRGLVAYNKNIKVAGEIIVPSDEADIEPQSLGASDFRTRSSGSATILDS